MDRKFLFKYKNSDMPNKQLLVHLGSEYSVTLSVQRLLELPSLNGLRAMKPGWHS
jgi:hypothetical protein